MFRPPRNVTLQSAPGRFTAVALFFVLAGTALHAWADAVTPAAPALDAGFAGEPVVDGRIHEVVEVVGTIERSPANATPAARPARSGAFTDQGDDYRGWSVAIDNDLFALSERDSDYTGGLGVTVSGNGTRNWLTLGTALEAIDRTVRAREPAGSESVFYSAQVGLLSFTPQDIRSRDVLDDDRPYASLLYTTSARQYLSEDERRVRQTGLTVGVLGLSVTSDIHGAIHEVVGSETPRGYRNQVSAGGEPTLRYTISDSRLRMQRLALGSGLLELKTTAELSVGYLTETSYAISTRIGAIGTPWWTFGPERVDYIAQPSAMPGASAAGELYFWAGAKVRLRAYNSFLQGQFRDSAHVFGAQELRHVIGEAWLGLTSQLSDGTQMSYAVRYQTTEVRKGLGRRDPVWAGVMLTRSFR